MKKDENDGNKVYDLEYKVVKGDSNQPSNSEQMKNYIYAEIATYSYEIVFDGRVSHYGSVHAKNLDDAWVQVREIEERTAGGISTETRVYTAGRRIVGCQFGASK